MTALVALPRLPAAPGEHGKGLDMQAVGPNGTTFLYEWNATYLNQLHDALAAVVPAHGTGRGEMGGTVFNRSLGHHGSSGHFEFCRLPCPLLTTNLIQCYIQMLEHSRSFI